MRTPSWKEFGDNSDLVAGVADAGNRRVVERDALHGVAALELMLEEAGRIHAARAFLPGMIARRHGRIVQVGSLAGRMGGLIAGPHYVASKGGVHALVKWLARQAGPHNVLVNGVAPASVDTPLMRDQPVDLARIPVGRKAQPEEVAWPIAFLCSAAASYICGAVLDVNGGAYMS